jgi:small-conductance mechanosensitive channel
LQCTSVTGGTLAVLDGIGAFLNRGIGGSEFTPLKLLVVITLMYALVWVTRRATHWLVDTVLARRGVDVGMREALGAIARYGVVALGTLVILQSAGIDLTSLNVLVGALGVGLGFGLQNITNNFFSGLILLFERPIRIGDRVEIAGAVGEIREIGARATTMVTDDNVALIVPNSQFISERVMNWSRPDKRTGYVLNFYVSHASDPALVRRVLLAAAAAHDDVLREPAAQVEFVEAGLAALRFQLQVWSTQHLKTAGTLKSDLNFDVWRQLAAAGVTVPPPQSAVTLGVQIGPMPNTVSADPATPAG